jgi:hypothetical protein
MTDNGEVDESTLVHAHITDKMRELLAKDFLWNRLIPYDVTGKVWLKEYFRQKGLVLADSGDVTYDGVRVGRVDMDGIRYDGETLSYNFAPYQALNHIVITVELEGSVVRENVTTAFERVVPAGCKDPQNPNCLCFACREQMTASTGGGGDTTTE